MVDRVLAGLRESEVETIYAAVSPKAPETRTHLEDRDGVATIETAGDGYVTDLMALLERPELAPPVLTRRRGPTAARGAGRRPSALAAHGDSDASRTVCVPAALKRRLGVSIDARLEPDDHLVPTGVNVVGTTDESTTMTDVRYDPRLAVNVNRLQDARVAADRLQRRSAEGR